MFFSVLQVSLIGTDKAITLFYLLLPQKIVSAELLAGFKLGDLAPNQAFNSTGGIKFGFGLSLADQDHQMLITDGI